MKLFIRRSSSLLAIAILFVFASCDRYHHLSEVNEKEMAKKERIYGDVGGPARQTKNTYPDNPDLIELKQQTLEAMYYDVWGLEKTKKEEEEEVDLPGVGVVEEAMTEDSVMEEGEMSLMENDSTQNTNEAPIEEAVDEEEE